MASLIEHFLLRNHPVVVLYRKLKEETERVIPGLRPPRENKMKSILRVLDEEFPESLTEDEIEERTGIESVHDFLTYANEENYLDFEDGNHTLEPEGQAYLSELEQAEANRVRKNTETILTVFLVMATLASAFAGFQTYQINQQRTSLEKIATDYMNPQPTCSWIRNNGSMTFMLSNTGSNAYLVTSIEINGTYIVDGYYGSINSTLSFTTGSHPVVAGESNRDYVLKENEIPIDVEQDKTTVSDIGLVKDVWMTVSMGDRTFSSTSPAEKIRCLEAEGKFFEQVD